MYRVKMGSVEILEIDLVSVILSRQGQPQNTSASMILADGKLMLLKDSQRQNARLLIVSSLPHSTSVRAKQQLNALYSTTLTPGMTTRFNLKQVTNAPFLILMTLL